MTPRNQEEQHELTQGGYAVYGNINLSATIKHTAFNKIQIIQIVSISYPSVPAE
ncbi:UNVERIFIED_CONTAM: hypothetical protein FKN15_075624 [Acipenser sinensis]